jgi:hypothetical protein
MDEHACILQYNLYITCGYMHAILAYMYIYIYKIFNACICRALPRFHYVIPAPLVFVLPLPRFFTFPSVSYKCF